MGGRECSNKIIGILIVAKRNTILVKKGRRAWHRLLRPLAPQEILIKEGTKEGHVFWSEMVVLGPGRRREIGQSRHPGDIGASGHVAASSSLGGRSLQSREYTRTRVMRSRASKGGSWVVAFRQRGLSNERTADFGGHNGWSGHGLDHTDTVYN